MCGGGWGSGRGPGLPRLLQLGCKNRIWETAMARWSSLSLSLTCTGRTLALLKFLENNSGYP